MQSAHASGRPADERAAARALLERVATRGAELDVAIALARDVLIGDDDVELRNRLVRWLEAIGDPGAAAAELPRVDPDSDRVTLARSRLQAATLHARSGAAQAAFEAAADAAALLASDPRPLELLATIAGASEHAALLEAGADALVRAAQRCEDGGDGAGALENARRAFELDPTSGRAATFLSSMLMTREERSAADEVLRRHASALIAADQKEASADVHARRASLALEHGDVGRAFGAALDEGLDGAFEGPRAAAFDALLERAGAFETLAVRLEMGAERFTLPEGGRAAQRAYRALGRVLAEASRAPERAVEAYARSVAADATDGEALAALRSLAMATQSGWLFEGLIRGAMGAAAYGASPETRVRLAAARALGADAEREGDVALAHWAYALVAELDAADERARSSADRLAAAARKHDDEIERAHRACDAGGEEHVSSLAELSRLLRSCPGRSSQLARVSVELAKLCPGDDAALTSALRVLERVSDFETIGALCRERFAAGALSPRLRLTLVAALRRAGHLADAYAMTHGLFDACTPWAYSVVWISAAVRGDRAARGQVLFALAPACDAAVVSTMSAVASEDLAASGDEAAARRAAEQACRFDANDARAVRALTALVRDAEGASAVEILERAIAASGPNAEWCRRLSDVCERLENASDAMAWARRLLSLRPFDLDVIDGFITRAERCGDANALAEACAVLVELPAPMARVAICLSRAIDALALLDAGRATDFADRALDGFGPSHEALRGAIERASDRAQDQGALRRKLEQRWIASLGPGPEQSDALLRLAGRFADAGDASREIACYARASEAGGLSQNARARLASLAERALEPDAEIALLRTRAMLEASEGDTEAAIGAYRELGGALWDMADDRVGAALAWKTAAALRPAHGYAVLRRDLTAFGDPAQALEVLADLLVHENDPLRASAIATEAARAASESGAYPRALALATTALERAPAHAEALEIAERVCKRIGRMREMSPLYDRVAGGSLGRFGRRATHHRAARFFETHAPMLSLKHAAQAFLAVPSEGTTLTLLTRAADGADRRAVAVRTVEHVAHLAKEPIVRAEWLRRAATLTPHDVEGLRQRVDLLLKAVVLAPAVGAVVKLERAARELLVLADEDREAVAVRLERATTTLARAAEGPEAARISIGFAWMALDLFGDAAWGWRALEHALRANADIDEYARLGPYVGLLSGLEGAGDTLATAFSITDTPHASVGVACLRLLGALALSAGDPPRAARAFVDAVEQDASDDELVDQADAALSAYTEPRLAERFAKAVGDARRCEALCAVGRRLAAAGDDVAAIDRFERAAHVAPDEMKADIAAELRQTLLRVGRAEDAILRELASDRLGEPERAKRWVEIARIRSEGGDPSGGTAALLQAATHEPTAERWTAVEQAAEATGAEEIRLVALQNLEHVVVEGERHDVRKRLARAEGARGALDAAEKAWNDVLRQDPDDEEAGAAIESFLVTRGDHEALAEHLGRRAERLARAPGQAEKLRAVRLRRAAILEQRLGRLDLAARELERLLEETPRHASALRWLADLHERSGSPQRALPVLEELQSSVEGAEREEIAARRARTLLGLGEHRAALDVVMRLVREMGVGAPAMLEVWVDAARKTEDSATLGSALEASARVSSKDAQARSEMLVEAAQAAARAGDTEASLVRAREAARLAPDAAATQLFACGLAYRLHGVGSIDDAKETVMALAGLHDAGVLEPEDVALRGFLLAEAEDVVSPGTGAGERTLRECLGGVGPEPLVALGLAERAFADGRMNEAVHFFVKAVPGNFLGLRPLGRVALAAADAAERADDGDAELRFLEVAMAEADSQAEALRRLRTSAFVPRDLALARTTLRRLAQIAKGPDAQADLLAQLARILIRSDQPGDRIDAERALRDAIDVAPAEVADRLRPQLVSAARASRSSMRAAEHVADTPRIPLAPAGLGDTRVEPAAPIPPEESSGPDLFSAFPPPLSERGRVYASSETTAVSGAPRIDPFTARVVEARTKIAAGAREEGEKILTSALREGSLAAADELDVLLSKDPARAAALLKVRRQAVELRAGDMTRLAALRDAAKLDQNPNYVRALDHVLRAFGSPLGPLPPPPLSAQSSQPGMLKLLTRHSRETAGEAFAIVWESASSIFAKAPTAYRMTGVERVAAGPMVTLTRLYEVALRLLDTPRFALYHRRASGRLVLSVALLQHPSAILEGDAREDGADLRWFLGRALSAVLPQNALPLGLPPEEGRVLWEVLVSAFGPPVRAKRDSSHAKLAELLWQALPPRAQRRLKELLERGDETSYELVVDRAQQSGRRVGMFLTGDFAHAARMVLAQDKTLDASLLEQPGGLLTLCASSQPLADLFRLAIRPEYADARWHVPTQQTMRPLASGALPPV